MRPPNQARPSRTGGDKAIGSRKTRGRNTPKSRRIALLPDPAIRSAAYRESGWPSFENAPTYTPDQIAAERSTDLANRCPGFHPGPPVPSPAEQSQLLEVTVMPAATAPWPPRQLSLPPRVRSP